MSFPTFTFTAAAGFLNPAGFQTTAAALGSSTLTFAPAVDGVPDPGGNLEIGPNGIDPDTVVSLDGGATWQSFSTALIGTVTGTPAFFNGNDNFEPGDPPTAVVIEIDGTQYVFFPDQPEADGPVNGVLKVAEGDGSLVICFCAGTQVLTPDGEVPVERLRPGDRVITRDHGAQPVRWVGITRLTPGPEMAPVLVRAGALGPGRPAKDLRVSPQHRLLLSGPEVALVAGASEVLVPAVHLVDGDSILREEVEGPVTYVHVMFDRHEVIWSEGQPSESFHPGTRGMAALDAPVRRELLALFPDLSRDPASYGPTARPALRRHEARLLRRAGERASRHQPNHPPSEIP